jgi:3-hydroxyacyl-CoA dehydrogenase/enoyl-CoA hydratase/3-hydroxybutyryl-CoA epimerase
MVRTLFLERLRAERELAAPAGVALERIATGPLGGALRGWADALAKARVPLADDAALPADTIELVGHDGQRARIGVATLDGAGVTSGPRAILSPAGPYGRVIESVGTDDDTHALVAALAGRLRALAWRAPGRASLLQSLYGLPLAQQAPIALEAAAASGAGDLAFIDTAACLSGVTPAWTGGPLTWAWSEQATVAPAFDAATRAAWARIEPALTRELA